MAVRSKYQVLDVWGYIASDATFANVENTKRTMRGNFKDAYPKVEVRQFQRAVKAGGACLPVTVIVARVRKEGK